MFFCGVGVETFSQPGVGGEKILSTPTPLSFLIKQMYVMEKIREILLVDAEYLRENYTLKQCSMYRNYIKKVIFNLRAANTSFINILETKKYKIYELAN